MTWRIAVVVTVGLFPWAAVSPGNEPTTLVPNRSNDALAGTLRGLIVRHAPPVLYEDFDDWGETKSVARGIKWTEGNLLPLPLKPHLMYKEKNHGTWKRVRITAENMKDTLVVDIRNVEQVAPGCKTFDLFVSFDAKIHYDQERWRSGLKTYDVGARARLRVRLGLRCEVTTRLESSGGLLPDTVFRLRVLHANLGYDNLVMEHLAGMGGTMAKLLGDAIRGFLRERRPFLETDLLRKANAAIVAAGDTKEIRVGLGSLFDSKDFFTESAVNLIKAPKTPPPPAPTPANNQPTWRPVSKR
jgi:hypothetical protein